MTRIKRKEVIPLVAQVRGLERNCLTSFGQSTCQQRQKQRSGQIIILHQPVLSVYQSLKIPLCEKGYNQFTNTLRKPLLNLT